MTYLEKSADEKCEMEGKLRMSRKESSMTPRTQPFYWTRCKDTDKDSELDQETDCTVKLRK